MQKLSFIQYLSLILFTLPSYIGGQAAESVTGKIVGIADGDMVTC